MQTCWREEIYAIKRIEYIEKHMTDDSNAKEKDWAERLREHRQRALARQRRKQRKMLKKTSKRHELVKEFYHSNNPELRKLKDLFKNDIPNIRRGEYWTQEEAAALAKEFENGETLQQIATKHQRNGNSIRARLLKLGLIEKLGIVTPEKFTQLVERGFLTNEEAVNANSQFQQNMFWGARAESTIYRALSEANYAPIKVNPIRTERRAGYPLKYPEKEGFPDFIASKNGTAFYVEAKTIGAQNSFTPAQKKVFPKLVSTGAILLIGMVTQNEDISWKFYTPHSNSKHY